MLGTEEFPFGYEFNVKKSVEVNTLTENAAKQAIAMVWNKNIGGPTSFNLVFSSRITNSKTGEDTDRSEGYDPNTDIFEFALKTMADRIKINLPEHDVMLIVAAHSAYHKVQCALGENTGTISMESRNAVDKEYYNRPEEQAAWSEALHVFKKLHPNAQGYFYHGKLKYIIPKKSKY